MSLEGQGAISPESLVVTHAGKQGLRLRPQNPRMLCETDLEPGDVILSSGDKALNEIIRFIDAGDYTHSSIWDGTEVYEATLSHGVVRQSISVTMKAQCLVDVFRFRSNGSRLGDAGWPPSP